MGEEIAFENGRISDFQGLMTLTLTLNWVILHTVMHHSSASTYIANFIEIEETFCGRTDGRTFETGFTSSTRRSRSKNYIHKSVAFGRSFMYINEVSAWLHRVLYSLTEVGSIVSYPSVAARRHAAASAAAAAGVDAGSSASVSTVRFLSTCS